MKRHSDAFGQSLIDFYEGKGGYGVVERDDGFVGLSEGLGPYFHDFRHLPAGHKKALRLARGRVLDVGCGAGRHSLCLQQKGLEVVGIDASPLAVKLCRLRGHRRVRVLPITKVSTKLGRFDTILMLGSNFGLFGSRKRARWLLRRWRNLTSDDARIIAESNDPYQTSTPCHLDYHKLNRRRGRMSGQLRIRVRYRVHATAWFDYLIVSKPEMAEILAGTGWRIRRFIDSGGSVYIAVIEKE